MNKILTVNQLIDSLVELGAHLLDPDEKLNMLIKSVSKHNAWFTAKYVRQAMIAIGNMLHPADLMDWLSTLSQEKSDISKTKKIGLVLAGNIPAVGWHDLLCVLVSGHQALIKISSQDQQLIPYILEKLIEIEPAFESQIVYLDRLKNFDAIIATGGNNTARYFDYYFRHVPNIIRKNRSSVAVLTGTESAADLVRLGHDIFDYFGLGCRNISKLYVPIGYNFAPFFEAIESFKWIGDHYKYKNNYDYNKAILLLNQDKHLDNGFLLLRSHEAIPSPLASLYYEAYADIVSLEKNLEPRRDQIQCIASVIPLQVRIAQVPLGDTQQPKLWDYADGVDTMEFLSNLSRRPI